MTARYNSRVLTSTLLTILFPMICNGQQLSVGVNGGAAFFAGMHADRSYYTRPLKTEPYSALTLSFTTGPYELALRLAANPVEGVYHNYFLNNMVYAQNPFEIMLLGNKHYPIVRFDVYSGLAIGMMIYKNPGAASLANLYPTSEFATSSGNGLVAGIQAGCNYNLSRRIDLNLEMAGYYTSIKAENNYLAKVSTMPVIKYHYSYVAFPVAVGVKYKFGPDARKKK